MGIHERAEEILALADYSGAGLAGQSHRSHARVGRGTFYLHIVLAIGGETVLACKNIDGRHVRAG